MMDRMTVSSHTHWRTDAPAADQEYEVWYGNGYRNAVCRDGQWYDAHTGSWLPGVTHWRPKAVQP